LGLSYFDVVVRCGLKNDVEITETILEINDLRDFERPYGRETGPLLVVCKPALNFCVLIIRQFFCFG
jgi:hypothetical protein